MTHRAADNLDLLDHESAKLLTTVEGLTTQDLARATLCTGWTVGHVLTHLSRNAEALLNLVRWAVDGQERDSYASDAARTDDIEAGAGRPLQDIVSDLRSSGERFRQEAEQLRGPAGEATVLSRLGTPVTGAQVIAMRSLEVVFHHVDLRVGYTFDDADPAWVARTMRGGARRWDALPQAPGLTLRPSGLAPMDIGGGGSAVSGTAGALLLWLARGRADGLSSEAELPSPPPWA
ncbi:MAG: maleylpyruvate isomerase family mycothiol-dependent enzyme [Ornithinimicrobium sp.]|uniref:maleylpyruvate isomerase family mycothiol-dependent enzyme n=1 Tax=Ornithinimicrobium sp. TaxID=1977084 RepID=UPI0026DF9EAA|nr:maleylpyruvate isomerase family mycothiol-dependent enzyme [Ornithinimicrobium sp.]MDO5739649.1 maleylpyruvate isomerase family mycothiol-dependent enzyme [Ornithinimicrobium sp.]